MFRGRTRLTVHARAKINLRLDILAERPDGYHELRSLLVPVSLVDTVDLESTDGAVETVVKSNGLQDSELGRLPESRSNLATLAAEGLRSLTGTRQGVRITLRKEIPVGSGLGGGSSDAAAVLAGLNRLWDLKLPRSELMALGSGIGCDVPALLHGGAVIMEGMGERIRAVHSPAGERGSWWVVLVNAGFPVSTRDIYQRWKCSSLLTCAAAPFTSIVSAWEKGDLDAVAGGLFNGLQETVFRKYPLIGMVAECLTGAGAEGTLLCGSGGSVFALARDRTDASRLANEVRRALALPSLWCRVVTTLPDGVMVAHGPLEA